MILNKRGNWEQETGKMGFTLIELLVVVAMIAVLGAAFTSSASSARQRARVQKATAEVKVVSQAILAYENWDQGSGRHELPVRSDVDVDKDSLGFILGDGGNAESGGKIPAMLMAALTSGGKMLDPWGTPYRVRIKESSLTVKPGSASGSLQTGFFLPNWYRIGRGER